MTIFHLLEIFGAVVAGAMVGGAGSYIGASFKMGARLIILEKSVSDYHMTNDRRITLMEEKAILEDVCAGCKALWTSKIDAYHMEAQKAVEAVKETTSRDMKILSENNSTITALLTDLIGAVSKIDGNIQTLKVVK